MLRDTFHKIAQLPVVHAHQAVRLIECYTHDYGNYKSVHLIAMMKQY